MIENDELGSKLMETGVTYFKVLSQNIPGQTEENHVVPKYG
jgi:hypothetical protein